VKTKPKFDSWSCKLLDSGNSDGIPVSQRCLLGRGWHGCARSIFCCNMERCSTSAAASFSFWQARTMPPYPASFRCPSRRPAAVAMVQTRMPKMVVRRQRPPGQTMFLVDLCNNSGSGLQPETVLLQFFQLLRHTKKRKCTPSAFLQKPDLCRAGFLGAALCSLRNPQNQASETPTLSETDPHFCRWNLHDTLTHDHCKIHGNCIV